jgi:phosphopentomutase
MLQNKFYNKYPDNLTFNYCMVMALHCYRQNALFFPISWREDDQVSNVKLFSQAKKVFVMLTSYMFMRKRFLGRDLRDTPRSNYTAQIVKHETGAPANE